MTAELDALVAAIRACRACAPSLAHEPRPVLQASATARLAIIGQAPGTKVHASGLPFTDASGDRLRAWTGLDLETFYDPARVFIAPMGFCFPGQDAKGADLPPRKECAPLWRARLFALAPQIETFVLVGHHAQRWHLGARAMPTLTETVANWRAYAPRFFAAPHPSWRNTGWLKRNAWFERDLVPALRARIRALV